jgi:hypothetical protein
LLTNKVGSSKSGSLRVKQSYMLLTWITYVSLNKGVKSIILPTKKYKSTLTKSPMAHKTFSQEQFQLKFFNYVIFYNYYNWYSIIGLKNSLNYIYSIDKTFKKDFISTNLFFLKKSTVSYNFTENKYFRYL